MTQPWDYRTDPLYRWLLAESADLEWQCVEEEFRVDLQRAEFGKSPAVEEAREATACLLRRR